MSTVQQKLKVIGELQIDGSSGYQASNAVINFIGTSGVGPIDLSQIRCFGYAGSYTLLLDGNNSTGGIAVRSNANEGDPYFLPNAKYDQYALTIASNTGETKVKRLSVKLDSTQFQNTFSGTPLIVVAKPNTTLSSSLKNSLAEFYIENCKIGEIITIDMGANMYGGCSVWSYHLPTSTSGSAVDNYSSFSMRRNGTDIENIRMLTDGSVLIPGKLTAGTIRATTYENLPPISAADLLPITLDKVNSRVGINNPNPQCALDVKGLTTIWYDNTHSVSFDYYNSDPAYPEVVFDLGGPGVGWINMSSDLTITGDVVISGTSRVNGAHMISSNDLYVGNDLILGTTNTTLPPEHRVCVRQVQGVPTHTAKTGSLALREDGSYGTTLYTKTPSGWTPVSPSYISYAFVGPIITIPSNNSTYSVVCGSITLEPGNYIVQLHLTQKLVNTALYLTVAGLQSSSVPMTGLASVEVDPAKGCIFWQQASVIIPTLSAGSTLTIPFPQQTFSLSTTTTLYLHMQPKPGSSHEIDPTKCFLRGTKF